MRSRLGRIRCSGVLRAYSVDHYSALLTSLQVKSDEVKIAELLASDLDQATQNQLVNLWRKSLRDYPSVVRISNSISKDVRNSDGVWRAALLAYALQMPGDLARAYKEIEPKLNEVPAAVIAESIKLVFMRQTKSESVLEFMKLLPKHILQSISEINIPVWKQVTTDELFLKSLIVLAEKGVIPYTQPAFDTLKSLSTEHKLRYMDAVTAYIKQSKTCSAVTTKLCILFINVSSHERLQGFFSALDAAQTDAYSHHPIGAVVLTELAKRDQCVDTTDESLKAVSSALKAETTPSAYNNLSKWGPKFRDSPRIYASLYANWLRCCAKEFPHDLQKYHSAARVACAETIGTKGKRGRERILLTGILQGLVETNNWGTINDYIPQIKQTNTPYLWNLAVTASKDWELVKLMRSKKLELSSAAMKALCRDGKLESFRNLINHTTSIPQHVIADYLMRVNAKNLYNYDDQIKFYRQVFDLIKTDFKSKHGLIYPILSNDVIKAVVWGALRTRPTQPFEVATFLRELTNEKLVKEETVATGIADALELVQSRNGTAQHIQRHLSMSVPELVKKFNTEWLINK